MNFQAISVGEKTPPTGGTAGGYSDASGTPNADLAAAITHTDESIGKMLTALKTAGVWNKTVVIITAKHGQSPVDMSKLQRVGHPIGDTVLAGTTIAQTTEDDIHAVASQPPRRRRNLCRRAEIDDAGATVTFADTVYSGAELKSTFDDPATDTRTPDIILQPIAGVISTGASKTKIAEHGGFTEDDTHVALLVGGEGIASSSVSTAVDTRQVAPTILKALGLDTSKLQGAQAEGTQVLPGLPF